MWALWLVLALLLSGAGDGKPEGPSQAEVHRQLAVQINDLAAQIRSEADAREFVDAIAEVFKKDLPPFWATSSVRQRVAHAEYEAVLDPSKLIPEQRIVDVWNRYVREIGSPEETLVTVAEIHSLRDGEQASAQVFWAKGSQNIWTMPNIYALGEDGRVASGSRTVEAVRVLYDLENQFSDLRLARERVRRGVTASDLLNRSQGTARAGWKPSILIAVSMGPNPVPEAEQIYIRRHGIGNLHRFWRRMSNELFLAGK